MSSTGDATGTPAPLHRNLRSVESAAVAGVVYSVLTVVALVLLRRFPDLDGSDEELTAWFDQGGHRGELILGLNLAAVGSIAFLWFVAVIRRRLGDREDQFFATVFLGSAIVYVSIWLVGAALLAAPAAALLVDDAASVTSGTASLTRGFASALMLVVGPRIQAVFLFSSATLIRRTDRLPDWLAYLGYAAGVILFTVPLVSDPVGIGLPLWVFIVSVRMLVDRSGRHQSEETS
ncbi:MAG: hypothetical protein ACERLM_09665 [Acidimicrobiales bacterium]